MLNFEAVIFDLDGVITQTALTHGLAWKKMFDEYLNTRVTKYKENFREFTHESDYLSFVDGKPRYEGVKAFLESRGITIPFGSKNDSPENETICGLGNRKNQIFNKLVTSEGVKIYDSSIKLIKALRRKGVKIGVASSSKNCQTILKSTELECLFETKVDGIVSSELNLRGKPDPDIFTTACDNLGISYDKAVIVEDAVSGVQAGKRGNFGLVIGVARENNEYELKINGADIIVTDLSQISIDDINQWFVDGLLKDQWCLTYYDYTGIFKEERKREVLLTIGNGYLGVRGAMEERSFDEIAYQGTYIAGVYNELESTVAGQKVSNEDLVNCPNWLNISFKQNNNPWFSLESQNIVSMSRKLDFKTGLLEKEMVVEDSKGNKTQINSQRMASMSNRHIAALRYKITPLNYSAKFTIDSELNGHIMNAGVERYKQLSSQHVVPLEQDGEKNYSNLLVQTTQSKIKIAEAAKLIIFYNNKEIKPQIKIDNSIKGRIVSKFEKYVSENEFISIEKLVTICTSQDDENTEEYDPLKRAIALIEDIGTFDSSFEESQEAWENIWKRIDIVLEGDRFTQKLLRMHMYHLMVTTSPHNETIDYSIPARGLHGEAYRGHIFWDTLFILPFFYIHFPNVGKSILMYRYRRLNQARNNAREHGYGGAMFPWQSGASGKEETQELHLNPRSGEWGSDYSPLQKHVSLAIAYNIWLYYWYTKDIIFIENYGTEIFLEICKFWASKIKINFEKKFYIEEVMGPDEFHEQLPKSSTPGLRNNFYTNIMVAWLFNRIFDILNIIQINSREKIFIQLGISTKDLEKWKKIPLNLELHFSDNGIAEQFEGFFNLKELDWDYYREEYGNIQRLDRILKAEGKSPNNYKVAKQADVLMIFYLLNINEIRKIIRNLGYSIPNEFERINFDYYYQRTSHGSTLSKLVHSFLLCILKELKESYLLFQDALISDYADIQGGSTGEGIHTGVMAGTVLITLFGYAGIDLSSKNVIINPRLPAHWKKLSFPLVFHNIDYSINVSQSTVEVKIYTGVKKPISVIICQKHYSLEQGKKLKVKY